MNARTANATTTLLTRTAEKVDTKVLCERNLQKPIYQNISQDARVINLKCNCLLFLLIFFQSTCITATLAISY
jgi:hypothetical protein